MPPDAVLTEPRLRGSFVVTAHGGAPSAVIQPTSGTGIEKPLPFPPRARETSAGSAFCTSAAGSGCVRPHARRRCLSFACVKSPRTEASASHGCSSGEPGLHQKQQQMLHLPLQAARHSLPASSVSLPCIHEEHYLTGAKLCVRRISLPFI